jgi:glucose/arabinose dehydrogenase
MTNPVHLLSDQLNSLIIVCILLLPAEWLYFVSYGSEGPSLDNKELMVEKIAEGLANPTGIAFIGSNDILVIEKNKGTVLRILNGEILPGPLLDVKVANEVERGLLGIAVANNSANNKVYVFLYYTEAQDVDGGKPIGNRLYRYELVNDKLINPKLLLDLPYLPGPAHDGGVVRIGPDNNVYVVVGNLLATALERLEGDSLDQNVRNGRAPDGRGGILRVTQDGEIVNGKGILGDEHPLDMYFAYGIRNSFGIDFDPVTGNLWDTENGGGYDEINLVEPGFNSGWEKVIGKASLQEDFDQDDLVDFNGKGKYSDPEFSWIANSEFRTAPTSIVFFDSNKFGEKYENDMFVADTRGYIYNFNLDNERKQLLLSGPLVDAVANDFSEIEDSIFAQFPGVITDLKVGPDGYLYVLLYQVRGQDEAGELFRVVSSII